MSDSKERIDGMNATTTYMLQQVLIEIRDSLPKKKVLTADEACAYLGFDRDYLLHLSKYKRIPAYNPVDDVYFYKLSELTAWAFARPSRLSLREITDKELEDALIDLRLEEGDNPEVEKKVKSLRISPKIAPKRNRKG